MPAKINMFLSNGNPSPAAFVMRSASLGVAPPAPKAPTALSAPFIARVHNAKPGCGSCGRK